MAYWQVSAYTADLKIIYNYQYSASFSDHDDDMSALYCPTAPNQDPESSLAFRST